MIKFYLDTVIIYFIIFIAYGLLTKKQFIKVRDKLRKECNDNSKVYGNFKTTLNYLLISFVPIVRLLSLIGRIYMIINPDVFIEKYKEKENKNE